MSNSLTEKYRPTCLDECILPERIKKPLKKLVKRGQLGHLIFYGKPGNGKTSTAKALIKELKSENFVEIVNKILEIKEWDVVFPGSGCNLRRQGSGLIRVQHPASKCTDSYLLTPDSAKKLYTTMQERIDIAIDWELSCQMMFHDLKVFWLEPPIVMQLSQNGTFQSAINGKKEDLYGGKEYVRFRSI